MGNAPSEKSSTKELNALYSTIKLINDQSNKRWFIKLY